MDIGSAHERDMRLGSARADAYSPGKKWPGGVGWGLLAFLSLAVSLYGLSYLVFGASRAPPGVNENGAGMVLLIAHAGLAGVALLIGPLQFLDSIRRRAPRVHRGIGRIYLSCCVAGGVMGALLAPFTTAGPVAGLGFFLLAVIWLWCAAMGWRAAVKGDFAAHKEWMIRSFALTFAAVTLRLYLIPPGIAGIDFVTSYRVIAWLCWVPNLIAAEAWISLRRRSNASSMQNVAEAGS